jgi:hypothetical protein
VAYHTIKEELGDIKGEQHPMLAFAASADPDTMTTMSLIQATYVEM